jgi:TPR repeat protein
MTKDITKAVYWYEQAANIGDVNSMFALGTLYYVGKNGEKNYLEAVKWYSLAAEKGNLQAMNTIGFIYYLGGYGIEKNREK